MRLGQQVGDLVEGATDEVHELELGDRAHARERGAEAGIDDRHLRDWRIDHAFGSEAVDQALSNFERAAVHADVFANTEHGRVALHLFPDSLADSFEVGDRWHAYFRCTAASSFFATPPVSRNFAVTGPYLGRMW